jgi:hypothetical protein
MKSPKPTVGNRLKIEQKHSSVDCPVFCFKYLHKDYHLNKCDDREKKCLMEQLVLISNHTWQQLKLSPRHGVGSEKIQISSIKPALPVSFTEDVEDLLAFRFDGMKVFVGFRSGFLFHVFYIDRDFTLYDHT